MSTAGSKMSKEISRVRPAITDQSYAIRIGETSLPMIIDEIAGWDQVAIIADENTARLFANDIRQQIVGSHSLVDLFVVPAGESSKSRACKGSIEDRMFKSGFGRSAGIVGIGGGVVLDLAGYIAASYMRGIRHINVATTLLAQVDAALGGKTGINVPAGKNLVGAFHQPQAVLVPRDTLLSLSDIDFRHGLAEVIKHAVIYDEALFSALEQWVAVSDIVAADFPEAILVRAIEIKAEVVTKDVHESGIRKTLNFGHTAAHGIEGASGHGTAHGDAVAMGMIIEAQIAHNTQNFSQEDLKRLRRLITNAKLPVSTCMPFEQAWPYMLNDKKNVDGVVHCALPLAIGTFVGDAAPPHWSTAVSKADFELAWQASLTLTS